MSTAPFYTEFIGPNFIISGDFVSAISSNSKTFPAINSRFQPFPVFSSHFQQFPAISSYFQLLPAISSNFQQCPAISSHEIMSLYNSLLGNYLTLNAWQTQVRNIWTTIILPTNINNAAFYLRGIVTHNMSIYQLTRQERPRW